jgi:integrase
MKKNKRRANGEGSIYYNKARDIYIAQVPVGYDENGKQKRISKSAKNKTEAMQKLKQLQLQIFNGEFIDESSITIYNLAYQMIIDKYNMNEINENTYETHLSTLKRLKPIYNTPLQKTNETQIRAFFQKHLDYSQSIIKKDYQMLKSTFLEAEKRGIIKKSPMINIKTPKSKQKKEKVRALTIDEQQKLINVLQTNDIKYSQQMLLSMFTGLRMGEVNALTVRDINLHFKTINVNKTISRGEKGKAILGDDAKTEAGTRIIPISDKIKPLITDCVRDKTDMLFTSSGKLVTTNQVNSEYNRVLKKYDIIDKNVKGKVTLHSLRHTYATRCIEGGISAKVLQKWLGHRDITITLNTYCDAFEQFEKEHINIVDDYMNKQGLTLEKYVC